MICPECKKNITSIVSDKLHKKSNTVERKRYCVCGNLFSTFEKFKKIRKIRKIRPDSYWKNERIHLYAMYRYNAAVKAFKKVFKKVGLVTKKIYDPKKQTSFFTADQRIKTIEDYNKIYGEKDNKKIKKTKDPFFNLKIFYEESKKKTISNIIKDPAYWNIRENIIDKSKDDKFDKDKVRKEIDEFYKSVCSYVKNDEYNQDFFIKMDPEMKWFWSDKEIWEIYTTVR